MIALIAGLFSRILSVAVIAIMSGAIYAMHGVNGFYMNWSGTQAGEGFEYHLLVMAMAVVPVINGSGVYSLDHYWHKKFNTLLVKRNKVLV